MAQEERVALIVGASSGMGRATARAYAEAGMRVALAARSAEQLEELAEEIGRGAVALPCDVTVPTSVEQMVDRVIKTCGSLDILVYKRYTYRAPSWIDQLIHLARSQQGITRQLTHYPP